MLRLLEQTKALSRRGRSTQVIKFFREIVTLSNPDGNRGLNIHIGRYHKSTASDPAISPSLISDSVPLWQTLGQLKNSIPVLKRIPRSARPSVAASLSKCIEHVSVHNITVLINLMLSGEVYEDIIEILYGANLLALKKKDGGIRPNAVGLHIWPYSIQNLLSTHLTDTFS
ncbi:hypothetical protein ACJJTC_013899 [Scirpophaga incertulas]